MTVVRMTGRPDGQQQQDEQSYPSRSDRTKVTLRLRHESAERARLWVARGRGRALQDLVSDLIDQAITLDGQTATMINDLTDRDDEVSARFLKPSHQHQRSTGRPDGHAPVVPGQSTPLTAVEIEQLPDTEREVLQFYTAYTGTPAKQRDRITFAALAHYPVHVLKSGILISVMRFNDRWQGKKHINSLRYCVGGIEECSDPDVGPAYTEHLINHWRRYFGQPTLPGVGADLVDFTVQPKV